MTSEQIKNVVDAVWFGVELPDSITDEEYKELIDSIIKAEKKGEFEIQFAEGVER